MLSDTPRLGLKRMSVDGSDLVDIDNQYNVNWDKLEQDYIPRNVNSGPRPNGVTAGAFLYEDNSISQLYSIGSNQWNCFGSRTLVFEHEFSYGGNIVTNSDTYMPIGNAAIDNRTCITQDANTVRLMIPGWYLLTASIRYSINTDGGMYLIAFELRNTSTAALIAVIQQSELKGNEAGGNALNIQALYRCDSPTQQDLKLACYQNSGTTRTLINDEGDGSHYTRFQCAYIRPLLQGV